MLLQESLHKLGLVCRQVVQNDMDLAPGGLGRNYAFEERNKLLAGVWPGFENAKQIHRRHRTTPTSLPVSLQSKTSEIPDVQARVHGSNERYGDSYCAIGASHGTIQDSGGRSIVVVQRSTQTFPALDGACVYQVVWVGLDQTVAQALMVALSVVVGHGVANGCTQRTLSEQDQPFEAGLLDAAHEARSA
jgi:hypothetical protein